MLYRRAEFESFEITVRNIGDMGLANAVIEAAGFGNGSFTIRVTEEDAKKKRDFLMVIREGVCDIDPALYLTVRDPDAEITQLQKNRFWIGFNRRYDHEVVEMIRQEIEGQVY